MKNDKSTDMVYARKAGMPNARFTRTAWEAMGKEKNGWTEITDAKAKAVKPAAAGKGDLDPEARYSVAMEKAGGFMADGKPDKALAEYARAAGFKNTKEAADGIKEAEAALSNALAGAAGGEKDAAKGKGKGGKAKGAGAAKTGEDDDLVGDTVLASADKAYEDEDYVLAKELYLAVEDQESDHVKGRLAEIADLLED